MPNEAHITNIATYPPGEDIVTVFPAVSSIEIVAMFASLQLSVIVSDNLLTFLLPMQVMIILLVVWFLSVIYRIDYVDLKSNATFPENAKWVIYPSSLGVLPAHRLVFAADKGGIIYGYGRRPTVGDDFMEYISATGDNVRLSTKTMQLSVADIF